MKTPSTGQKSLVIHRLLRIEQPWERILILKKKIFLAIITNQIITV